MPVGGRRGLHMMMGLVALMVVGLVLPSPSWALVGRPQVIAVHTASGSRVSMVVEADLESGGNLTPDQLSVTVGGRSVATTVTPLASSSLSVALVIDTSAGLRPDELEAVQSGVTEFLLRLPTGARSMVIAAGGSPRVVAPLNPGPGQALSAVSAVRPDGDPATAAGVQLAARELQAAPAGPREIVVFSTGVDESAPTIEQLAQGVGQAGAVTYIVQTRPDDFWAELVERAGGAVLSTETAQVVASYETLATALEDQYLVTFQAPVALPAVAAVGVAGGDPATARTVVRLPEPGDVAPESGASEVGNRWGPILVLALGLALVMLLALALVRARRTAGRQVAPEPVPAERTEAVLSRGEKAPEPVPAERTQAVLSRGEKAPEPVPAERTETVFSRGEKKSLGAQPPLAALLSGVESAKGAPALRRIKPPPSAPGDSGPGVTLRGNGDGVVTLRKKDPGPAAIRITGNAEGHFFGVRTLGGNIDVLNTIDPYEGVRALDWEGGESTGFEVRAAGPWTIEVLPIAAVPSFDTTFSGTGDIVLRYTGDGSTAKITGNEEARYFSVRTLRGSGPPVRLVNTTQAYADSCPLMGGPALFAVEAVGPWTIAVV